jgi:hypothetical protein
MRAMVLERTRTPFIMRERPTPEPKQGEILKVTAGAVDSFVYFQNYNKGDLKGNEAELSEADLDKVSGQTRSPPPPLGMSAFAGCSPLSRACERSRSLRGGIRPLLVH